MVQALALNPSLRLGIVWPQLRLVDGITAVAGECTEDELRHSAGGRTRRVGLEKQAAALTEAAYNSVRDGVSVDVSAIAVYVTTDQCHLLWPEKTLSLSFCIDTSP